jgi:hypothetical protein
MADNFIHKIVTGPKVPYIAHRYLARALWVAQHISYLCSSSVHTFVSVAGVNVTKSARILPESSDKVVGSGLYVSAEEEV